MEVSTLGAQRQELLVHVACGQGCLLGGCSSTDRQLLRIQAAAKPSKPAEKDDAAPKDRNGDDNNGPSRGSQPVTAAGSATPGAATASGGAQGNRGGAAGASNAAPGSDRRHGTDRRRTAGELVVWLGARLMDLGTPQSIFIDVCLSRYDGDLTDPDIVLWTKLFCAHVLSWTLITVHRAQCMRHCNASGSTPGTMTGTDPQALEVILGILGETIQGRGPRRPRTGATRTRKTPESPRRRGAAARRCPPALWRSSTAWSTWCCALRGRTREQPMRVRSCRPPLLFPVCCVTRPACC